MGAYIEVPENKGKARQILDIYGGKDVSGERPLTFADIPPGDALICVVDNGLFEAAAWVYDRREFVEFSDTRDSRPKQWLLIPL